MEPINNFSGFCSRTEYLVRWNTLTFGHTIRSAITNIFGLVKKQFFILVCVVLPTKEVSVTLGLVSVKGSGHTIDLRFRKVWKDSCWFVRLELVVDAGDATRCVWQTSGASNFAGNCSLKVL